MIAHKPPLKSYALHLGLFLLAFFTTTLAGAELITGRFWVTWGSEEIPPEWTLSWGDFWQGLPYSLSFLAFLTVHEFGHYFAALYHRVKASLPYYLPIFIPIPGVLNIGSLGAVIRLKEVPPTTRKYFDIGVAGPLAGFVISLFLLGYGFTHLPHMESYVLERELHYAPIFGAVPDEAQLTAYLEAEEQAFGYYVGSSLLFELMEALLVEDSKQMPSHFDLIRYPFLFVGYITLFFTALNLLPMGQLDGGHVIYGMFGRRVGGQVSRLAAIALLFLGGTGLADFRSLIYTDLETGLWNLFYLALYAAFVLYISSHIVGRGNWREAGMVALVLLSCQLLLKWNFPGIEYNSIWLLYTWMVVRFVRLDHPPAYFEHRVGPQRQALGWLAILIFVVCFTPTPLSVVGA